MPKPASQNSKKLNRKKGLFILFFTIFIGLSGLIGGSLFESEELLFIRLNETELTLTEGDSTLVTFEASRQLGSFVYSSNDSSVVQFIENRLIALTPGNATVTVSSQSNPSVFQTVSVIVRQRDIEPEVPGDPEVPVEPEPELPEEPVDPQPEGPVDPQPEVPVDPTDPDDESVVTPPLIYTITITNETGAVITTLEVEEGSFITTSALDLPETFKGFYLEGETCTDDPFDLETPITENLTLIQASFNGQAPCLQLDYIVLSGRPVAGTELTVDIFPVGANVTISWYTSVNNRTYREILGESSSTFTVRPEDSGKFIRVYVVSDSNPPVVRYDTIKLDVFGTLSEEDDNDISQPDPAIQQAILDGFIPISNKQELSYITTTSSVTFGSGTFYELVTEGGLHKEYILVNDVTLSGVTYNFSFIQGTFTGTFDGNGFELSDLTVVSANPNAGLFEKLDGALISNLKINNFDITGTQSVGTLVGLIDEASNIQLLNIHITNSSVASSGSFAGGFIGQLRETSVVVSRSSFSGTVDSVSNGSGGIVGNIRTFNSNRSHLEIFDVQVYGVIEGNFNVGGFIGLASRVQIHISQSENHAVIEGFENVGGFIGTAGEFDNTQTNSVLSEIFLEDSLNLGLVKATNNSGGLFGKIASSNSPVHTTVTSVYSVGNITGTGTNFGSLIGTTNQPISFSSVVYLVQNTLQPIGATSNSPTISGTPSGLHISQMVTLDTFVNAGWNIASDLSTTWAIGFEGGLTYPYLSLRNQPIDSQKVTLNQNQQFYLDKLIAGYGLINTRDDLESLNITGSYILTSDISLAGEDWIPIANFSGTLDGNGFTISNGKINQSGTNEVGFFKQISGASISNLTFYNFNVTGAAHTGLIVGQINGGINIISSITITNSSVQGTTRVGGLIGYNFGSSLTLNTIINHTVVKGSAPGVGGIFGRSDNELAMSRILNFGQVEGSSDSNGGFIGFLGSTSNITISQSGNLGNIISSSNGAGGFIGQSASNAKLNIEDSFNLGNVTIMGNFNNLGGIFGYINDSLITISAVYSTGDITTSGVRAGLIFGRFDDAITQLEIGLTVFSLKTLSVNDDGFDINNAAYNLASTKISPSQMATLSTFKNADWSIASYSDSNDTNSVWVIGYENGQATYPWLRWMVTPRPAQFISTVVTENVVVNISADDPSSFASYPLIGGVTVTSITNTSVFDFNGSSGFIDLGQPLSVNESFTFEAWVFDETGTFNNSISRHIFSSENTVFFIGGTTLYGGIDGAEEIFTESSSFPKNAWRHLILTFDDPNDTLKMYINGYEVSSKITSKSFQGETLRAGAHFSGGSAASFWAGMMNEFRVYNRALTADEVSGNYNATKDKYE